MKKDSETALSAQHRLRRIEGRHNPLVKQLRQAFARAELTENGDCAIEGLRILEEAIRSGLRFNAVFFRESAQDRAERLLPQSVLRWKPCCFPTNCSTASCPANRHKA